MYAAMSAGTTRMRRRLPATGSSRGHRGRALTAPQLALRGEAHDRADQILFGGELERCDTVPSERRGQHHLTPIDDLREPAAEARIVRVDPQVLPRLGVVHH